MIHFLIIKQEVIAKINIVNRNNNMGKSINKKISEEVKHTIV